MIAFLDVQLMKQSDGKLATTVYRKPSNTNLTIRPQSCQHPRTSTASFKGELCRAHRICSSPELLKKEIEFIIDLYCANGHDRNHLEEIAANYSPPSPDSNPTTKSRSKQTVAHAQVEQVPTNLFHVLPFRGIDLANGEEYRPYAHIPYLPGNTYQQIRRSLTKAGVNTCPTSGQLYC